MIVRKDKTSLCILIMLQVTIGSYAQESAAEVDALVLKPGQFLQDSEGDTSRRTMSEQDMVSLSSESLPDELINKIPSSRIERQSNSLPSGGFKYFSLSQ